MSSFNTVLRESTGLYRDKGSKFFGYLFPIKSEAEFKERLLRLKEKYHDARHHCFAYVLEGDTISFNSSDDGEPRHSAGDPILNALKSKELVNVGAVVVRYFGGTKLGVPGLIRAYKDTINEAIYNNEIAVKSRTTRYNIIFGYQESRKVKSILSRDSVEILTEQWDTTIQFQVAIEKSSEKNVIDNIKQLQTVQVQVL